MTAAGHEVLLRQRSRRAAALLLLVLAVAFVVASHALHQRIEAIAAVAAGFVDQHTLAGALVFLLLSVLAAMLAFFSTAALVPVAVTAWGNLTTIVLLWCGWFLGGVISYLIGRYLGRSAVKRFIPERRLREYERQLCEIVGFPQTLLLQLALPSEIPGYVLGTMRFPMRIYVVSLALAELPFALGAVYIGESFLRGDLVLLVGLGFGGIALSWTAATILHRRLLAKRRRGEGSETPVRRELHELEPRDSGQA